MSGQASCDRVLPCVVEDLPKLATICSISCKLFSEGETVTSDKQTRANRRNALMSTGPKTPQGKAAGQNALSHGLLSAEMLLPGEDEAALKELSESLRDELQPNGELEGLLVERIIAAAWRLRRLGRVEAGIFAWERFEELAERAEREARGYESPSFYVDPLQDVNIEISDGEKHREALSRAQQMRSEQEAETATLGRTFARDANGANAFRGGYLEMGSFRKNGGYKDGSGETLRLSLKSPR